MSRGPYPSNLELFVFAFLVGVLLTLLCSCAHGPVEHVRVEQSIDMSKKNSGCFVYLPEDKQVTLISWPTCELVIHQEQRQ